ncbi:glutamate-5-semialdehyde dehydrogenase [Desulfitispora alkaliphila]
MREEILTKGKQAKAAAHKMATTSTEIKNQALMNMADRLENMSDQIIEANKLDIAAGEEKGLSRYLLDRLLLTPERIKDMAVGLRELVQLEDPVGKVLSMWTRPNGLQVGKVQVPLGVIGIIYESRPNVTVDAAGLCLKTGNAILLRGGSEAINSNKAIAQIIAQAAEEAGAPQYCIQLVETTDRQAVNEMLKMNQYLDVLIPRGGAGLIKTVVENATVPVIETGVGNCHVYIDKDADVNKAVQIAVNSKTQRPGVCNACESVLVHKDISEKVLPGLAQELKKAGVELRGCNATEKVVSGLKEATEEDFATEYLDLILAIKVVNDVDEAMEHIYKFGTKHSEAIVTENYTTARKFLQGVDAAAVYVNASTRFTDGFQFGFGAEIGISTQKLHARGPMGLEQLTSTKFIIYGDGQIRS